MDEELFVPGVTMLRTVYKQGIPIGNRTFLTHENLCGIAGKTVEVIPLFGCFGTLSYQVVHQGSLVCVIDIPHSERRLSAQAYSSSRRVERKERPFFESLMERFIWALKNDEWNERDERLSKQNPAIYELALITAKKS